MGKPGSYWIQGVLLVLLVISASATTDKVWKEISEYSHGIIRGTNVEFDVKVFLLIAGKWLARIPPTSPSPDAEIQFSSF